MPDERGDWGYLTDQGISAISHRKFHRTPAKTLTDIYQESECRKVESAKNCHGLNGYTNSHMDITAQNNDSHETMKPVQEEKLKPLGRGQSWHSTDEKYTQSDNSSSCQRMRGVRGSHYSNDEIVRDRIQQRRQIILNQYYGNTLESDKVLNEALGAKPKITTHGKNGENENGLSLGKVRGSPSYGRGAILTSNNENSLKSQANTSMCSNTSSKDKLPKGRGAILFNQTSSQSLVQADGRLHSDTGEVSDTDSIFKTRPLKQTLCENSLNSDNESIFRTRSQPDRWSGCETRLNSDNESIFRTRSQPDSRSGCETRLNSDNESRFGTRSWLQPDSQSGCETWLTSDNESIYGRSRSGRESLSSKIKSVSEMDSCTESESGALSRNERRKRTKLSSFNTNGPSDSFQSAIGKSNQLVQSDYVICKTSNALMKNASRMSGMQTSNRGTPHDDLSGNESATSEVSIAAASVRGQGEFKGGRLPRSTGAKGNPDRRSDNDEFLVRSQQTQAVSSSRAVNQSKTRLPLTSDLTSGSGPKLANHPEHTESRKPLSFRSSLDNQSETRQSITTDFSSSRPTLMNQSETRQLSTTDLTSVRTSLGNQSQTRQNVTSGASSDDSLVQKITSPRKLQTLISESSPENYKNQSRKQIIGQLSLKESREPIPNEGAVVAKSLNMAVPGKKAQQQFSSTRTSVTSDEDLKVYCQPCDRDGPRLPAFGYCSDCKEHLCETCFSLHRRHTLSRHHTLLDKNNMPQTMSTAVAHSSQPDNLTKPCPKHMKEMIRFYCPDHKQLLCCVCVALKHTGTSCDIKYIPEISEQVLATKEHHDILEAMDTISKQCSMKLEDVNKLTTKSNGSLADVLADIKEFRQELNRRLDELEIQAEDAAKAIQQENFNNLKTVESTCDDITKYLKTSSDTIKQLYTSKQTDSLFIELKLAEKMIKDYEKRIQQLSVYHVKDYSFQPNKAISTLLEKERSLGTSAEKSLKQASHPSADIFSRQTSHQGEICVKTPKDRETCWISGLTVLSPDILIITDWNNKSIKMVDTSSQSVTDQLQLATRPYDVTSVTSTELAVTLPDKQIIQFVSVSSNKLAKKRTMKVEGHCSGISCYQGKFVVSFSNPAKLQILDTNGTMLTTISGRNNFCNPMYVAANTSSIYVSDIGMKTCTLLNWKGEVMGSYGGISVPLGITLSDDGTVFVCYSERNIIEEISGDCSTGKVVLNLTCPYAVCWCSQTSKLYYSSKTVNEKHDNFLHIFKLGQND